MSLLSFFVSLAALITTALLLPSLTFVCASRIGLESGPWRRDWPSSGGANGLRRISAFEANHRPRWANAGQLRTHAEKSLNGRRIRPAALTQSRRAQLLATTGSNANELVGFGNIVFTKDSLAHNFSRRIALSPLRFLCVQDQALPWSHLSFRMDQSIQSHSLDCCNSISKMILKIYVSWVPLGKHRSLPWTSELRFCNWQ
jgi:hypothetical protein